MSLLFMDSFAHYLAADYPQKYNGAGMSGPASIQTTLGRRGGPCMQSGNGTMWSRAFIPGDNTSVVGMAMNFPVASAADMIRWYDSGGNEQYHIGLNSNRTLYAGKPFSAVDATSTLLLTVGGYNYIETKVLIADSGGTIEVRVNGVVYIAATGLDTKQSGTAGWSRIDVISGSFPTLMHDMYVLDGVGAAPWNNFLGDCRVDVRAVTAAGATTGWTPSTGANWQNVDDATPNGDTDYNSVTASGPTDTFVVQDAPVVGATIYGVQTVISNKKMDAGACTIASVIRHSGTDNVGANFNPSTAYTMALQAYQTNPGTGVAWTEAGFNAAEFGYKRTT